MCHKHDLDIAGDSLRSAIKALLKEAHQIIQGVLGPFGLQGFDGFPAFYADELPTSYPRQTATLSEAEIRLAVALAGYRDGHRFWFVSPVHSCVYAAEQAMRSQFRPQFEGMHRVFPATMHLAYASHC